MASMLESGNRRWTPHALAAYEEALGPGATLLRRAYVDAEVDGDAQALLKTERCADLLDAITASSREPTSTDVIEVVRWVTGRHDPLGRTSWESLVRYVVDRACDTKGLVVESCNQALLPIVMHPVGGRILHEYYLQVASEVGHPKAFVPVIALQAAGAQVDLVRLVAELESPNNRWLIREHLNLAAAKISHGALGWNDQLRSRVEKAAFAWLIDTTSEHEVKRAAARVLHELGVGRTDAVLRLRVPDDVARISSGVPSEAARALVELDAMHVLSELGSANQAELQHDPILVELLADCIHGSSDHLRREATRWLRFSAYSPTLANRARERIGNARGADLDTGRLRAWARLLGKLGSSETDSAVLLDLVQWSGAPVATRETAVWALCDLAVLALVGRTGSEWEMVVGNFPQRSRGTMQRAITSALGRSREWETLSAISGLESEADVERAWWLARRAP